MGVRVQAKGKELIRNCRWEGNQEVRFEKYVLEELISVCYELFFRKIFCDLFDVEVEGEE